MAECPICLLPFEASASPRGGQAAQYCSRACRDVRNAERRLASTLRKWRKLTPLEVVRNAAPKLRGRLMTLSNEALNGLDKNPPAGGTRGKRLGQAE